MQEILNVNIVDRTPTAEMKNAAMTWFKEKLPAQSGQIVFSGLWQEAWKVDFPNGESNKTRAVLSLYEDASQDAYLLLDHSGVYCEVTLDSAVIAQKRAWASRFSDLKVGDDGKQRYLWCLKSGRAK